MTGTKWDIPLGPSLLPSLFPPSLSSFLYAFHILAIRNTIYDFLAFYPTTTSASVRVRPLTKGNAYQFRPAIKSNPPRFALHFLCWEGKTKSRNDLVVFRLEKSNTFPLNLR